MAMIRWLPFWQRVRPIVDGGGLMFVMFARLAERLHRPPYFMARAIAPKDIPNTISRTFPAFCRRMLIAAVTAAMILTEVRGRLYRRFIGCMHGSSSLSSPTSWPIPDAAKMRRRYHPSHLKLSHGLMQSFAIEREINASMPIHGCRHGKSRSNRSSSTS